MAEKITLSEDRRDEAERLASLPYSVLVLRDSTTNGEPIYLAINPELDGCMAHGKTSEAAIENLKEARIDYIQVQLLSGDSIPVPAAMKVEFTNSPEPIMFLTSYKAQKTAPLSNIIVDIAQPEHRQFIGEYNFKMLKPLEA